MPFSIAPGPFHKIPLRDFDLIQQRDSVTSWRHGVTKLNLFYSSQLVDVLGRLIFLASSKYHRKKKRIIYYSFLFSMILWAAEFNNVVGFVFTQ